MANPYHDFTAAPVTHPYEELNKSIGGLGDAVAAHFEQQKKNEDAIKLMVMKAQIERENAIAQENAKQGSEFDYEQKRMDRARNMYPDMFPGAPGANSNIPSDAPAPAQEPPQPVQSGSFRVGDGKWIKAQGNPLSGAFPLTMGKQAGMQPNTPPPADFNPVKAQSQDTVKSNRLSGWDVNPNFMVSGKGDMFAKKQDNSLQLQEKQDQFNQREWDKLTKEVNPLTTSGRNPLGMAMKANYNANRALSTLSNPMVTNQEAGNVMADIASIYQNGSPTQFGMQEQAYHTLRSKIAGVAQYFTGKPQDALTPEIKNRLQNVLYDMKRTNFDVLKQNIAYTEKAKAKLIKAFPQEWQDMKETLMSDGYSGLGKQSGGGDMNAKIQKARESGYSEEEIQKYLQGKM